jgi:hypothetical protein
MCCTSTEGLRNFWPSYRERNRYHMSGQHSYTGGPLAYTNALRSDSPDLKYHAECPSFINSFRHFLITLLITSLQLLPDTTNLSQATERTVF